MCAEHVSRPLLPGGRSATFPAQVWRNGDSLVVTIKKRVVEKLGLKPGDNVLITITVLGEQ
ncbi:MAG: AbrB/MazE/SpoVT family DNA-binding domain-containing protein [Crenarchaeota archaeon]|nr:AbrB/MazE/SpoVT family DNA-binding domain-containing protein [Thermoproteota archaeon]